MKVSELDNFREKEDGSNNYKYRVAMSMNMRSLRALIMQWNVVRSKKFIIVSTAGSMWSYAVLDKKMIPNSRAAGE